MQRRSGLKVALCALLVLLSIHGSLAVRRSDDQEDQDSDIDTVDADPPAQDVPTKVSETARHAASEQNPSDDSYDPDEFTSTTNEPKRTEDAPSIETNTVPPPVEEDTLPPYFLEGSVLCFVIFFAITFVIGKGRNEEIAHSWARLVLEDTTRAGLNNNFYLVGDNSSRPEKVLVKDSQSHFIMHATGRRHCKSLLATLDLTKRHDLFTVIYNQIFTKPSQTADLLKIHIPLNDIGKFCLAICSNKTEVKKNKSECSDIAKFTDAVVCKKLPKDMVLLTDCEEIVPEILRGAYPALEKLKHLLRVIHISDKSESDPRYPSMIRLEFQLPPLTEDEGRILAKDMIQLAIHLIDVVAKASEWQTKHNTVAIKVEQRRAERSKSKRKHEAMQEASQVRKDKKIQAEKEKMNNMDPEQLRKYEEKKYRKDTRKRNSMSSKTKMIKG